MNLVSVKPKVTLLGVTRPIEGNNPEKIVASAAKLCYSSSDASTLMDGLTDDKTEEFLNRLSNFGHQSPIEHISFNFGIEGISRACSHQIVRHRIASYSQQSQRYVDLKSTDKIGFVVPPEIEKDKKMYAKYVTKIQDDFNLYGEITGFLESKYINELSQDKITKRLKSKARKKALEDARYLLPNACETKLVMTMNARSLWNFFSTRCCNRAQWKIREVAD